MPTFANLKSEHTKNSNIDLERKHKKNEFFKTICV